MEELGLGPNGGLIYCMEHLEENLDEWLAEELDNYLDDDHLVFDCPGQIELFSHVHMLRNFVEHLKRKNFNVCGVYLLDSEVCLSYASSLVSALFFSSFLGITLSLVMHIHHLKFFYLCQFITDVTKFVSGCMASLFAMVQLELQHVNILSKMDLVTSKRDVKNYLDPEPRFLLSELNEWMAPWFKKLNKYLIEQVDEYSMVSFIPLDLRRKAAYSMHWLK
ncbi:hypothetical protein J1N35_021382 [Gossypium stocksii]|uniref:GPN-loop GTPase 3 n=1 Tax=Gossypium stocksii TaxID=47602 RepID=A0A9D4A050_9ROSI|nr:hypothetical protein J1N35_021382 [Gossypium stocksii]